MTLISNNDLLLGFVSILGTTQRKLLQNLSKPMETIFCQEPRFTRYSEGRESIKEGPRSGKPSTSRTDENIDKIWDLVHSDCLLTVSIFGEELSLTHTTD